LLLFTLIILSLANHEGKYSFFNLYSLADQFAPLLIELNEPSERFLVLFKRFLDSYRTGELLIPCVMMKAVGVVEGAVCYHDFKYRVVPNIDDVTEEIAQFSSNVEQG
jgi:hypothetical protein